MCRYPPPYVDGLQVPPSQLGPLTRYVPGRTSQGALGLTKDRVGGRCTSPACPEHLNSQKHPHAGNGRPALPWHWDRQTPLLPLL